MADYDWFAPTERERQEQQLLLKIEHDNQMSVVHVSSAVDTKFYMCNLCHTILYHSKVSIKKHRDTFHPTPKSHIGKHVRGI